MIFCYYFLDKLDHATRQIKIDSTAFVFSLQINEIRNQMEKDNELNRKYKVDEFNRFMTSPLVLKRAKCAKLKGSFFMCFSSLTVRKVRYPGVAFLHIAKFNFTRCGLIWC